MKQIRLDLDTIYVQNLCRNYFKDVTDKNPYYEEIAKQYWIPHLKDELNFFFDPQIPVITTAWKVLTVLAPDVKKYRNKKREVYKNGIIAPGENGLNRPVIPMFRGGATYYDFNNAEWHVYAKNIQKALSKLK